MGKRLNSKHKIDRRLGVNLWGRPKSPLNNRDYAPGQHGQRRRKPSDFGVQLSAKQKLKGYYGNIGEKQGIDQIASAVQAVVAARRDGDPPVRFVIAGAGAGRDVIENAMRTHGLNDQLLKLMPLQPEAKLPALLAMADIHLLPQKAEAADLVMPSKLGGMLSSGRPVVASADPGTQIAQMVASCGTVVAPADGPAMGAAVLALARDRDLRLRLGIAARAAAESEWERHAVLERFEAALELRVAAHKGVPKDTAHKGAPKDTAHKGAPRDKEAS